MTLGEYAWLAEAYHEREQRADHRAAVLAMFLSQSRTFRADKYFPSLARAGSDGGQTFQLTDDEIPEHWVQVKGDEAAQWMLALSLDNLTVKR